MKSIHVLDDNDNNDEHGVENPPSMKVAREPLPNKRSSIRDMQKTLDDSIRDFAPPASASALSSSIAATTILRGTTNNKRPSERKISFHLSDDNDSIEDEILRQEDNTPSRNESCYNNKHHHKSLNESINMIQFQETEAILDEENAASLIQESSPPVAGAALGSPKTSFQRPATYRDFLKAQRRMSVRGLSSSQVREAARLVEEDAESSTTDDQPESSPSDARRLFQSMRVLAPKVQGSHNAVAVESMIYELEKRMKKLDVDGHFKDKNTLQAPWYSVPIQRQRWGDEQILPDSNYGSLFFDLFFIGAVYNIQAMLLSGLSNDWLRSVIYFVGIFGPIFVTWETDVYYHSRYCVVDYAHRLVDVIRFVFVTAAVLFIQPMPELRSPTTSIAPFGLTVSIFLESITHLLLNIELYYKAEGDRTAIQNHTFRKVKRQLIPTSLTYLLASLSAAIFYFVPMDHIPLEGALWSVTDIPLTLTAVGYLTNTVFTVIRKLHATNGAVDIRNTFVPNNIDYVISRYNDWFLLLLGEVVMAMVEVTDSQRDYLVASMGALTTIVVHTLKFESEPGHAHGHALWRNISNATCFGLLTQLLSTGLILFGVSYKVLLTDGRFGLSGQVCNIFVCVSLAWVLITLELMVMTHKGLTNSWRRLFTANENGAEVPYWPLVWLTLFKAGLFAFLLTIPLWTSNTDVAVVSGVVVVILVAITRIIGWAFVFREEEIREFVSKTTKKLVSTVSFAAYSSFDQCESRSAFSGASDVGETQRGVGNSSGGGGLRKNLKASLYRSIRGEGAAKTIVEESDGGDDLESAETGSVASLNSFSSRQKRAEVYDEMFDAVVLIDLKGFIVTVNKTALEVFRYESKNDLIGKNVSMLVGGDDAKHHDSYLEAFHRKGKDQSQIGKQRILKAKRSDDTEFPCIIGIKRSSNHKYLVGYIRDVTGISTFNHSNSAKSLGSDDSSDDDDNNFEISNRTSAVDTRYAKYLKRTLDNKSFDCIVVADFYGVIQGVNDTLVRVFGFRSKDELFGENISVLMGGGVTPEKHDGYLARFRDKNEHGDSTARILGKQRQLYATRRDGTEFKCIIGIHDIEGIDLIVGYIRNLEESLSSSLSSPPAEQTLS